MTDSLPVPFDVKLMNLTASVLFAALALMLAAAAVWWAVRHPAFSLAGIRVQGDVMHNNAVTLRANVAPRLAGNFFTVDLARTRAVFESVPWVRRAVVRREFPDHLRVELQEHQAAAYWGAEGDSRLVNTFGEVFEANPGDVDSDDLPRLSGPDGQSAQVLQMYRAIAPLLEPVDASVDQLELTGRGSWRAQLANGAVLELGRGTVDELMERTARFAGTLTQIASKYGRRNGQDLESADLRHTGGYALKLRGVTTVAADTPRK